MNLCECGWVDMDMAAGVGVIHRRGCKDTRPGDAQVSTYYTAPVLSEGPTTPAGRIQAAIEKKAAIEKINEELSKPRLTVEESETYKQAASVHARRAEELQAQNTKLRQQLRQVTAQRDELFKARYGVSPEEQLEANKPKQTRMAAQSDAPEGWEFN